MAQPVKSAYFNPAGGPVEWTYLDPNGNKYVAPRRFPGNQAATLVYRLLNQDFSAVDSVDMPHVIEAIEVLTYFGKRVVVASGGTDVNSYTLRIEG